MKKIQITRMNKVRPFRIGFLAAVILLTSPVMPSSAQDGLLELDDLRLETRLSGIALSPDGSSAIVVASRPNYEDNRFDRSLYLVDLSTGSRLDLTPHRPKVGQPRRSAVAERQCHELLAPVTDCLCAPTRPTTWPSPIRQALILAMSRTIL